MLVCGGVGAPGAPAALRAHLVTLPCRGGCVRQGGAVWRPEVAKGAGGDLVTQHNTTRGWRKKAENPNFIQGDYDREGLREYGVL